MIYDGFKHMFEMIYPSRDCMHQEHVDVKHTRSNMMTLSEVLIILIFWYSVSCSSVLCICA